MHHYKIFYHVEIFRKKAFGGCISQIFFFGDQNAGHGDRMGEARRRSEMHGDGFAEPGGSLELVSSILHLFFISKINFLM